MKAMSAHNPEQVILPVVPNAELLIELCLIP
jgi:hypothetical protein